MTRGALLAIWILLIGVSSQGFIFIRGTSSGNVWNKGARPVKNAPVWANQEVTFRINPNLYAHGSAFTPGTDAGNFVRAAEAAIRAWGAACKADLKIQLGPYTSGLKEGGDSQNVISWWNKNAGDAAPDSTVPFSSTGTLAAAFTSQSSDYIVDCDIMVNGAFVYNSQTGTFGTAGESNLYDLTSTLVHELGHCLGLDHPIEPDAVSNAAYWSGNPFLFLSTMVQASQAGVGSTFRRTINQDDKDAIHCIYQSGKTLRSGNFCASYHGTDGGGEISGEQTGGAHTDLPINCASEKDTLNFTKIPNQKGHGCIGSAIGSTGSFDARDEEENDLWSFLFIILLGAAGTCLVKAKLQNRGRSLS